MRYTITLYKGSSYGPKKIKYAVAGLGYFGQSAVLPAFAHAKKNSELVALISDDLVKSKTLGRRYNVPYQSNSLHREFTERAAKLEKHVLCEKPMAVTEEDCRAMIDASAPPLS